MPLIGIAGALHEQAYATVEVLATEQAIAHTIERLATAPGPGIADADVDRAVRAKERELGRTAHPGQFDAVRAVCSSGRSVESSSASPAPARPPPSTPPPPPSRQPATACSGPRPADRPPAPSEPKRTSRPARSRSLLWRLDHGQVALDQRTVVIVDEAAMADDADLLRLVTRRRAGRSEGRARRRSPPALGDRARRSARRAPRPPPRARSRPSTRTSANATPPSVPPWPSCATGPSTRPSTGTSPEAAPRCPPTAPRPWPAWSTPGPPTRRRPRHRPAGLAARRRPGPQPPRPRHRWQQGWITGPDLVAPGGRRYAAGDQSSSSPRSRSQASSPASASPSPPSTTRHRTLAARTDDGRAASRSTDAAIDADHLDHGYALTVHRAQGATYDRAHVLAAGGGRELAYVALSRARRATTLHAIADDLAQALDDLGPDWSTTATSTGSPAPPPGRRPDRSRAAWKITKPSGKVSVAELAALDQLRPAERES